MNEDPIERFLKMTEGLAEALTTPAEKLPVDVVAKLNQRIFGRPSIAESLTSDEIDTVVLLIIRSRASTASELVEALNKDGVKFDGGDGAIFGLLQNLERQAYVKAEWQERANQRLRVYSLTDDGIELVKRAAAEEQKLVLIAERVSLVFSPA